MDKIIELSEQIDNISNINDKVKLVKNLNVMIEEEKRNINEKISIYLAIDRYYTNIEEELFDVE